MTRRFTLTTPDGTAEATQFSSGIIVADLSSFAEPLYVWVDLDALQREQPTWVITWIDPTDTTEETP